MTTEHPKPGLAETLEHLVAHHRHMSDMPVPDGFDAAVIAVVRAAQTCDWHGGPHLAALAKLGEIVDTGR